MYKFNAKWHREGTIKLQQRKCHVCKEKALCLCIDSSEGEYGAGHICKNCIDEMYAKSNKKGRDANE